MTWALSVAAKDERRLYARIFLVLEQQRVAIESIHAETHQGQVEVKLVLSSEEDKASRIQSLLYRLHDVHSVSVMPRQD